MKMEEKVNLVIQDVCLWKLVKELEEKYDILQECCQTTQKALDKEGNFSIFFFWLFLISLFINFITIMELIWTR